MMKFDRSNKKRLAVSLHLFVTKHVLLLIILSCAAILFSCTKSQVIPVKTVTPPPVVTTSVPAPRYIFTSNPEITIGNYVLPKNSNTDNSVYVGKLYGSKKGDYSFAGYDKLYAYAVHDSLYLTKGGISKLISEKKLDLNILAGIDSATTFSKPVRLLTDDFIKNRVIAHRGAYFAAGLPENSIASLKQTILMGYQASEFDVHLTLDKVLVVCHDDTYAGYTIEQATYAQLNQTKLSNGENLPLLKDFLLEAIKQQKTRLDLELKRSVISQARGYELGDSVLSLVHQLKAQAWINNYASFDYLILKRIRTRDSSSKCAYLVSGRDDAPINKLLADGIGMDYSYYDLITFKTTSRLNDCVNAGIYVSVWTVDAQSSILNILALCPKISAIVTNKPEFVLTLVPPL